MNDWKSRTMLIGLIVGAITGVFASWIIIQRAEKEAIKPRISAGEGARIGLGVFSLLKMVSDLGVRK